MSITTNLQNHDERLAMLFTTMAAIPAGRLTSYGELAQAAGLGRAARWVGRALSQLPADSQLPWHRVIRADGQLLGSDHSSAQEQRNRLREEGLTIMGNKVDLSAHRWHPTGCKG